jgi:predicted nucleic acid-binding protein
VRLFLDSSVMLAASGSSTGASRELFARSENNNWKLVTTPYAIEEVLTNLPDLGAAATAEWALLRPMVTIVDDVLTLDRPIVFESAKDRPILLSALAWADILLTLDRRDFGSLIGNTLYDLQIQTPGRFLLEERAANRLH